MLMPTPWPPSFSYMKGPVSAGSRRHELGAQRNVSKVSALEENAFLGQRRKLEE